MTAIILHHFDISPFAEKIRLALGIKGLAWHSVQIPIVHAETRSARADRRLYVLPIMIELYFFPSPNGLKIAIMLEECGLPYEVHPVDIGRGEQFRP